MIGSDPAAVAGMKLSRTVLKRVWRFAAPYRRLIFGFLAVIVASSLLSLVPPLLFREILDDAIPDADRGLLHMLAAFVVAAALARRPPRPRRALPLVAHRRGDHLRPAGVAVRPRAAAADVVLHPSPDRRARRAA